MSTLKDRISEFSKPIKQGLKSIVYGVPLSMALTNFMDYNANMYDCERNIGIVSVEEMMKSELDGRKYHRPIPDILEAMLTGIGRTLAYYDCQDLQEQNNKKSPAK